MGTHFYIKDQDSEFGYTSVSEDDYVVAILRIARKKGIKISNAMVLKELEEMNKEEKNA